MQRDIYYDTRGRCVKYTTSKNEKCKKRNGIGWKDY